MRNILVWLALPLVLLSGCGVRGTSFPKGDSGAAYVILYFAGADGGYLAPEARDVAAANKPLPNTIIEELIRGPSNMLRGTLPGNLKLNSVKVKGTAAYVDFKSDFTSETGQSLAINSVVNSLTELPGIDSVQFLIEGRRYKSPFKRCRSAFKRDCMNPSQVLQAQMAFEKKGDYLNGYMLMSDEKSELRKYYGDYVNELDEARDDGLLEADFTVGDYVLDESGTSAMVRVNFITDAPGGERLKGADVFFKTVLIDGCWRVDWSVYNGGDA